MNAHIRWVRPGDLARSPRPGYAPGWEHAVERQAVDRWIGQARDLGIRSIIVLLDRDQLPLYEASLPDGLIAHYKQAGLVVAHVPTPDGKLHPFTSEQLDAAWRAYLDLPKPVLVHCSAGYDRTGRVVNYILDRLADRSNGSLAAE